MYCWQLQLINIRFYRSGKKRKSFNYGFVHHHNVTVISPKYTDRYMCVVVMIQSFDWLTL